MIRIALIGLGKMGLSHHAIVNAHPEAQLVAVCDPATYVLEVLGKYTGMRCYTDYLQMLERERPDAVFIATPSRLHGAMVRQALERGMHVFCEKPFCLDLAEGARLVELAERSGLVNQVGYHNRFVGAFEEARRLVETGVLGPLHHVRAEAYGPVVLKAKGATWRAKRSEGGGCLYDYASHALDLLNFVVGMPDAVAGTVLSPVFSGSVDDEVYATLLYPGGMSGQLAANWSDESLRKMTTRLTVWGRDGKLSADRQELQLFLGASAQPLRAAAPPNGARAPLRRGWNARDATELSHEVWYYLRGEEYSAQVAHFIASVQARMPATRSSFRSAHEADQVIAMLLADAAGARPGAVRPSDGEEVLAPARWRGWINQLSARVRPS